MSNGNFTKLRDIESFNESFAKLAILSGIPVLLKYYIQVIASELLIAFIEILDEHINKSLWNVNSV